MPIIDILGVPHAYELTPPSVNANNPVLVFIHGWLLSRNYWKPLIEQLSPDYQCLVYDLRGFGESQLITVDRDRNLSAIAASGAAQSAIAQFSLSEKIANPNNGDYSLAAYANDLCLLVQKLGIKKAWAIGHSLGGSIALWGAHLSPELIQGAICLNSGGGIYLKEEFERFRAAGQQLILRRPRWLSVLPLIDLLFARIMVARPLDRHWGRQRVIDLVRADEKAAIGSLLDSTTEAEVHLLPRLVAKLQQPVYFIAGDKDTVMEPKYVRHLASFHELFATNSGNVIELTDCGHLSMIEQPDVVGEKIVRILMEHSLH
jgi:pimeloyl-ACP methyl ester carboxylesterase